MTASPQTIQASALARAIPVSCPLCGGGRIGASWFGSVYYRGRDFGYSGCRTCGSVFCNPMPEYETLCDMYGVGCEEDPDVPAPPTATSPDGTTRLLMDLGSGTLIDYGCGSGAFLLNAARLGWNAVGVEFDRVRAQDVENKTGLRVVDSDSEFIQTAAGLADVVHLGDVLEHLTQIESEFPFILNLLKPGGLLIATGPLDGNATLFNFALRSVRFFTRRIRRPENPPRHVILATARGQKALFDRFGLAQLEFSTCEVSWPAPSSIAFGDLKKPRSVALFILSWISRAVRRLEPAEWGNRYYYVGRWRGPNPDK